MGDRNNLIKFGPEWMRNFSRESNAANPSSGQGGGGGPGPSGLNASPPGLNTYSTTLNSPAVRYGREEMLALYDSNIPTPAELRSFDLLYNPRKKTPIALNTFDEEVPPRETSNMRSGMPVSTMPSMDMYAGTGRGVFRGIPLGSPVDSRGRGRTPFMRQIPSTRGGFSKGGGPAAHERGGDEPLDAQPGPSRSWGAGASPLNRNGGPDQNADWSKNYKKWQGHTNWRRIPGREDNNEEWRSSEPNRSRPGDRSDWGERSEHGRERMASWNSNRRNWSNETEDNLPEWAVEGAEACGGTFDSSGAFHGYSNDDSNLPSKNENMATPLSRSQTQGNFVKPSDKGPNEWSSEKFKNSSSMPHQYNIRKRLGIRDDAPPTSEASTSAGAAAAPPDDPAPPKPKEEPDHNLKKDNQDQRKMPYKIEGFEGKTFDSLIRSDIHAEEANDEVGNFQSVMITPNNSLRTRHQHIVSTASEPPPPKPQPTTSVESQSIKRPTEPLLIYKDPMDLAFDNLSIDDIPMPPTSAQAPSSAGMVMGSVSAASPLVGQQSDPMARASAAFSTQSIVRNTLPSMQPSVGVAATIPRVTAGNSSMAMPMGSPLNTRMMRPSMTSSAMPLMPPVVMPSPVMPPPRMSSPSLCIASVRACTPLPRAAYTDAHISPTSNSLFLGQNGNNTGHQQIQVSGVKPAQHGMFPMHSMQQNTGYTGSIYGGGMQIPPGIAGAQESDMWYYEDPAKNIQGPFTSMVMYNWYKMGFFKPDLMVRRACDAHMRPLGSYEPDIPFAVNPLMSFPMSGAYDPRSQAPRDSILNAQQSLALGDMMNIPNISDLNMEPLEFGNVGSSFMGNTPMPPIPDPLWSSAQAMSMWTPDAAPPAPPPLTNEDIASFFWDLEPNAMATKSMVPDDIVKGMKTEEQILAQLRAAQGGEQPFLKQEPQPDPGAAYLPPPPPAAAAPAPTPDLGELHKLIQKDTLATKEEKPIEKKVEPPQEEPKPAPPPQKEKKSKAETEKSSKKEVNGKKKKNKEEKKEEQEAKKEDDATKSDKQEETTKSKKEEKLSKRDLEKEKKEWIKEGFTIVKGPEKTPKESKKKNEENKAAEEAERKSRKEDDKSGANEEDKKRKQGDTARRQQQEQSSASNRAEQSSRRAPWSGSGAGAAAELTLADIQRLEREKKLEQMREQQQMVQLIAQQQQAQLAREQEMQAGLGWHKKKGAPTNAPESLAEIQAEARKQAAAAAAAAAASAAAEQPPAPAPAPVPWAKPHNGGGFWDTERSTQSQKAEAPQPPPSEPVKAKRKKEPAAAAAPPPPKKELSPAIEFEGWCSSALSAWTTKIDVPTFVGFLKDIESPYEVKDYVKCYLGDTRDANDFAKQFLERRSKMWRASAVTHSDDLSHPAPAVIPRAGANCDHYLEAKNKGKKTKKNKMQKVDACILGFSVTASEDRINVGDIDTA